MAAPAIRRRRLLWGLLGMLVSGMLVNALLVKNSPTRVLLESGESFDVISLTLDERAYGMGRGSNAERRILLNYWSRANSPLTRVQEADLVLQIARPAADSLGISVILVEQTLPVLARWTGLVTGYAFTYTRAVDGDWKRGRDHVR